MTLWEEFTEDFGVFAYIGAVSVVLFGALCVYAVAGSMRVASLEPRCLRAGYPEVRLTWAFEAFCVKRMEQTDVVVPVENLQR